jgi:hypothetical protein
MKAIFDAGEADHSGAPLGRSEDLTLAIRWEGNESGHEKRARRLKRETMSLSHNASWTPVSNLKLVVLYRPFAIGCR